MEIGLMLEGQEGTTWGQWCEVAEVAEHYKFDGLYSSDHYLTEGSDRKRGSLDAWGVMSALAVRTEKLRLGTVVSPVTFRHPSILAKLAITANHISEGRIDLAMGTGWFEEEHRAYGFPFPPLRSRTQMLREQLEIVRSSWEDKSFSFSGDHYTIGNLNALPKPDPYDSPRLIVGGGGGPKSLAAAAEWADEYNCPMPASDEQVRDRIEAFREAMKSAGRMSQDVKFSVMANVLIGVDESEVSARVADGVDIPGEGNDRHLSNLGALPKPWIVGSPEQAVSRLRQIESLGVTRVILEPATRADMTMIELIGDRVVSNLTAPN